MVDGRIPSNQFPSYGSSLTIEELTPAGPGFKLRQLILMGPSLPFMGAEWGSELNMHTEYYPGNPEATQQVLGPRELPSSWEGEWNRTRMGRVPTIYMDEQGATNRIVSPMVLRELFEDIHRSGQRLRVTWAVQGATIIGDPRRGLAHAEDVKMIRVGRIKTFKTPIDRHTDMHWSAEFHWLGRGAQQDKAAAVRSDNNLATAANGLEASVNASIKAANSKIVSSTPANRKSATHFTLGQLEQLASLPTKTAQVYARQLQQNVSAFKRIGDVVQKLRSQPFAASNAVVDFARNTTAISNRFIDDMGQQPPEQRALKAKVSSLLRTNNYFAEIVRAAVLNARRAQDIERQTRQVLLSGANRGALSVKESQTTRAGDVIAIHVCKEGDTPQVVSRKYYQNADHGLDILKANRLPYYTPTFNKGQILIIPALTSALARSRA